MNSLLFILLTLLMSCSSTKENRHLAWEEWKGHSVSELAQHSYFKNLKLKRITHDKENETWLFRDQSAFQTGAYCQGLGGCMSLPSINCNSAFSIKNGMIMGLEQSGSCPPLKLIAPEKKSAE